MTARTSTASSWILLAFFVSFVSICASALTAAETTTREAKEILAATGVKGGLVVHIGCGNGQLTAASDGDVDGLRRKLAGVVGDDVEFEVTVDDGVHEAAGAVVGAAARRDADGLGGGEDGDGRPPAPTAG